MANLLRTDRTYATYQNAVKALDRALGGKDKTEQARYVIAASWDGRFAPVLVGAQYIPFIHEGITVVG